MDKTKHCPYCGEEIKSVAKKCKHCGEWLYDSAKPPIVHKEAESPKDKPKYNKYIAIVGCAVVVIVLALVLPRSIKSNSTEEYDIMENAETENTVIEVAPVHSTIDEVEARIKEYDANLTPEEKAQEPWRIHLDKLQGSYLIDATSTMADLDMIHNYGKFVISGNTLKQYDWDENSNSWKLGFQSDFQLFKFQESGYMTGYNLLYIDQDGNECRMCSGDLNEDGKMDLWQSGSIFWTKQ